MFNKPTLLQIFFCLERSRKRIWTCLRNGMGPSSHRNSCKVSMLFTFSSSLTPIQINQPIRNKYAIGSILQVLQVKVDTHSMGQCPLLGWACLTNWARVISISKVRHSVLFLCRLTANKNL
jgi:hypothetical protein